MSGPCRFVWGALIGPVLAVALAPVTVPLALAGVAVLALASGTSEDPDDEALAELAVVLVAATLVAPLATTVSPTWQLIRGFQKE